MRLARAEFLFFAALIVSSAAFAADRSVAPASTPHEPFAIATFHCVGIYWSPAGGAVDKPVEVRFRAAGAREWQEGLPMRYHPIEGTDAELADYRGSIVHLQPGTNYEIELTLAGTSTTARLTAAT